MAGYTKNYSIAVWTGYDRPQSASPISDTYTNSAQWLYKDEMQYLDSRNHASNWKMPDTVEAVRVNGKRQLVIKDSKWALEYAAIDDDDDSSSSSSESRSSSLSSSIVSSSSVFSNNQEQNSSSQTTQSSNANTTTPGNGNGNQQPNTQPSNGNNNQ